jgi:hypothetical protein
MGITIWFIIILNKRNIKFFGIMSAQNMLRLIEVRIFNKLLKSFKIFFSSQKEVTRKFGYPLWL